MNARYNKFWDVKINLMKGVRVCRDCHAIPFNNCDWIYSGEQLQFFIDLKQKNLTDCTLKNILDKYWYAIAWWMKCNAYMYTVKML